jgi:uncharacterized protein YecE (DUF72 family)
MARLFVGLSALTGDLEKYERRFDLVELRPVDTQLPRESTLRKWRRSVPPTFAFSVVLPRAAGALTPGRELDEALAKSLEIAATVEARCVVLQTPVDVRPTNANKKRLAAFFARVPPEGTVRCWEPQGLWERDDVVATSRELGVVPVFDAARDAPAPGPIAYTRLRALGKTAALGAATLERVAERLRKRREVFVVVEGPRDAQRVKAALATALAKKRDRAPGATVVRPAMPMQLVAEDEEQ